jgi:hypothetical protein
MGLLSLFAKPPAKLFRLSAGSFTVDREGNVLASTLPQSFPAELVRDTAIQVLGVFRSAQTAKVPLTELIIHYYCLKLTARELRGGAIIFVTPLTMSTKKK